MTKSYIEPTEAAAKKLFSPNHKGPVVMVNLLRYRDVADYSEAPELAPEKTISGLEAYKKYMQEAGRFLVDVGGEVLFAGKALDFFVGPEDEHWDHALLVKYNSLEEFKAFASHPGYLKIVGHRTAALADSRLLPLLKSYG